MTFRSHIVVSFQQITFKLGSFTNFKALFSGSFQWYRRIFPWSISEGEKHLGRVSSLKYQYDYDYESHALNMLPTTFSFSALEISLIYSRERQLPLILKEEKKLIGQYTRLEKMKIYPSENLKPQGKSRYVFMCARLSRVKLCTGRMRNAVLRNNLNDTDVHNESFKSASKTYSPK